MSGYQSILNNSIIADTLDADYAPKIHFHTVSDITDFSAIFDATFAGKSSTQLSDTANIVYESEFSDRFDTEFKLAYSTDLADTGNIVYTVDFASLFDTNLSLKTTDSLVEGAFNKYYDDALARSALSAGVGISYNQSTGVITNSTVSDVSGNTTAIAQNTSDIAANLDLITANATDINANSVTILALQTDLDGFPDTLKGLTANEIAQIANINALTISNTQWGYVAGLNQALSTSSSVSFAGLTVGTLDGFVKATSGSIGVSVIDIGDVVGGSQVAVNTSNIASNSGLISTNAANISSNSGSVASNTTAIGVNTADISTNQTNISTNSSGIASNTTAIGVNTADITSLQSTTVSNTSNITANTTAIGVNTADISTNQTNIAGNSSGIASNTTAIGVNTADISTNQTNISSNAGNITSNTTAIGVNTADISTNTSSISSNTSAIAALDTDDVAEAKNLYHTTARVESVITSKLGVADWICDLNSSGKIPHSRLPDLSITHVYTAASELAMLSLSVDQGDVVVRTDEQKNYIHNGGSSGDMTDFTELLTPTDTVLSVNGDTGVVVLDSGDIAESVNLYFTNARARLAISGGSGINYDNGTGVITCTIPDLTTSVNNNTTNISTNSSGISTNASSIASNTSSISTNSSDIGVLQTDVTANASSIASNTTNISTNSTDISTLQTDVTANASSIASNTTNISTNSTDIGVLQTDVTANASSIASNTSSISTNSTDISTLQTDVTTNASSIASNTSSISTNSTDIASNTTNISTILGWNTNNISEGSGNLYFTTARARSSISGGAGISYNSSTGVIEATGGGGGTVDSIIGTVNQVIANSSVGDITLSLPQSIATSSTVQFGKVNVNASSHANIDLRVQGAAQISDGNGYAVETGYMANGSLTLGGRNTNYGGGSGWNGSTAQILLECKDNTEIMVHDSGARLASLMAYTGASNLLTIGRNAGWGTSNCKFDGKVILNLSTFDPPTTGTYGNSGMSIVLQTGSSSSYASGIGMQNTSIQYTARGDHYFYSQNNQVFSIGSSGDIACGGSVSCKRNVVNTNTTPVYNSGGYSDSELMYIGYNGDAWNGNGNTYTTGGNVKLKAQDLIWAGGTRVYGSEVYLESGRSPFANKVAGKLLLKTNNTTRLTVESDGIVRVGSNFWANNVSEGYLTYTTNYSGALLAINTTSYYIRSGKACSVVLKGWKGTIAYNNAIIVNLPFTSANIGEQEHVCWCINNSVTNWSRAIILSGSATVHIYFNTGSYFTAGTYGGFEEISFTYLMA